MHAPIGVLNAPEGSISVLQEEAGRFAGSRSVAARLVLDSDLGVEIAKCCYDCRRDGKWEYDEDGRSGWHPIGEE